MAEPVDMKLKELIKNSLKGVDLSTEITDEIVDTYFTLSKNAILSRRYPFHENIENLEFPTQYQGLCVRLAVYMYNKQGAEGETSHTENGVTIHWENGDLPESLMSEIVPLAKVLE